MIGEGAQLEVNGVGQVAGAELVALPNVDHARCRRASEVGGGPGRRHQRRCDDRKPGRLPCVETARELTDQVVVADLERLPDDLVDLLIGVAHDHDRPRRVRHPAEPGRERRSKRVGHRARKVPRREVGRRADVDHLTTRGDDRPNLGRGQPGQDGRLGRRRGAEPVQLTEAGEVGRVAAQPGEQSGHELRFGCPTVDADQQRVGGSLPADGADPVRPWRGRTERPGAVRGPDQGLVRQFEQPLNRGVLGSGQFQGAIAPDQVGPGGGADQERSAGEHPDRVVAVEQQEGEVLRGVAGCGDRPQAQTAQADLVAVSQAGVRVAPVACC